MVPEETNHGYAGQERRRVIQVELSDTQIDTIVERVYEKLYINIGKSVVNKSIFVVGTVVLAVYLFGEKLIHKVLGIG